MTTYIIDICYFLYKVPFVGMYESSSLPGGIRPNMINCTTSLSSRDEILVIIFTMDSSSNWGRISTRVSRSMSDILQIKNWKWWSEALNWNGTFYPTNRAVYNVIVSHLIKYSLLHRMASPSFEMKATSTKHLEGFSFLRESLFALASLEAVL